MKNYQNCLMYKLYNDDYDEIYIGHTTMSLQERFNVHKYYSSVNSSKVYSFINDHGGMKDWKIDIIEHYPCNNLIEAKEREAQLIKLFNSKLNNNIPLQTNKEWRSINKERYNTYMREYMRHYNEDKKHIKEL